MKKPMQGHRVWWLAASCVLLTACETAPKRTLTGKEIPSQFDTVAQHWQQKLKEGNAILITAVPSAATGDSPNNFVRNKKQFSYNARWAAEAEVQPEMRNLVLYRNSFDNMKFEVTVIPAGTYVMNQFRAELRGASFDEKLAVKQPASLGVGTVDYFQGRVYDMVSTSIWREPTYERQTSNRPFCAAVIAGTTQCVSSGYVKEVQNVMTKPAGYETLSALQQKDALGVRVNLRRPFASITLQPGEVIITDGIVAELPNVETAKNTCLLSPQKTARCELSAFKAETFPVPVEQFKQVDMNMTVFSMKRLLEAENLPPDTSSYSALGGMMGGILAHSSDVPVSASMLGILRSAQYRALTPYGTETGEKPNFFGKVYTLRSGKK